MCGGAKTKGLLRILMIRYSMAAHMTSDFPFDVSSISCLRVPPETEHRFLRGWYPGLCGSDCTWRCMRVPRLWDLFGLLEVSLSAHEHMRWSEVKMCVSRVIASRQNLCVSRFAGFPRFSVLGSFLNRESAIGLFSGKCKGS